MNAKPGPEPRRSSGDSLCDILEDSERFARKRWRRRFPSIVVFATCMSFLAAVISVIVGWTTIPRAAAMALMLFIGPVGVIAYKTYVARNCECTPGFRIAHSLVLMTGIVAPQWGTDKFANLLAGLVIGAVVVVISQSASHFLKKD